eukprot:SAG22_NODE_58_length_23645_cov_16.637943_10_plen_76_part_00
MARGASVSMGEATRLGVRGRRQGVRGRRQLSAGRVLAWLVARTPNCGGGASAGLLGAVGASPYRGWGPTRLPALT